MIFTVSSVSDSRCRDLHEKLCVKFFLRIFYVLGELVGTQRKKAEHAMFENQFERRVSSTKRVRNAKAKTCAEDHTTPF